MRKDKDRTVKNEIRTWLLLRREVIQFFLVFVVALGAFSFILEQERVQQSLVSPHLHHVAWICGNILSAVGTQNDEGEATISCARFSVRVVKGCESLYPTAMLWAAMLAYPASWKSKILGMATGAVILFVVNLVRVITMFYVGIFAPSLFDIVHVYAWQALFILLTLAVWLVWAARVSNKKAPKSV